AHEAGEAVDNQGEALGWSGGWGGVGGWGHGSGKVRNALLATRHNACVTSYAPYSVGYNNTLSIPPALADSTYCFIHSGPSTCLAISTTM
ncbi:MAG: hypothetical protein RIR70_1949, partial [Pseudomonadota bacterium]